MANDIGDILKFQLGKRITNVAKVSLEQLEKARDYENKIQVLLLNLGFDKEEDKEFFIAEDNFKCARKTILDNLGENKREMEDLIGQFKVEFK